MISRDYITEILLEDILEFHAELEESDIPVEDGVRDMALLESAVNAPFQTFGGQDLFPSIYEKAARLLYGIANNHAFVDGNKRTAVHAMEVFLIMNRVSLDYTIDEMEVMVIGIADNTWTYEEAVQWITKHAR
ncbi:type II toxin-antitoxin system death-on-curing family toxin [Selenomonas ruminis]|uniref:Type II toxin-antitoxin system death-on-curing family toxin n=1 Tax=Selenomonas ruminis TaxID=2593411 RepID=A0A5D6W8C4_9FIRM|nr:type II toxin-antitoxin system death-on-curing family toxin [Selenomonas sp. mPRGC5]TYZ24060.1 type II toxin-antitoxin system death-on-curing family toxin [Selenomonas sp. mPRGC5]